MESDWVMIYATPDVHKAHMLKDMLEAEEIKVVLMNKSGYPYTNLGDVELFVFWQQAEKALEIIFNSNS